MERDIVEKCYDIAILIIDEEITSSKNFENLMKYFIKNAILTIKKYCAIDTISEEYYNAVTNLAIVYFNNQKALLDNSKEDRIISKTQGSRSESYRDVSVPMSGGVPDFIKAMIPTPKIKVIG